MLNSHCTEHEWKLPESADGGKYSLFNALDEADQAADPTETEPEEIASSEFN